MTPATLRRMFCSTLVAAVAVTGLGVVGLVTPLNAGAYDADQGMASGASMHRVGTDAPTPDRSPNATPSRAPAATMHRVLFDTWSFDTSVQPSLAPTEHLWVTQPGDHLWAVAQETLAEAWGTQPSEAQVAAYWQKVLDTNRSRLVSPANPDLIYPGQVFLLPSAPETLP